MFRSSALAETAPRKFHPDSALRLCCGTARCLFAVAAGALGFNAALSAAEPEVVTMDPHLVYSSPDSFYTEAAQTALKSGVGLLEIPFSVNQISGALLSDLAAANLAAALPYTVGVSDSGVGASNFTMRGLNVNRPNLVVDGMPGLPSRFGSPMTGNIERVEILKGPASVLYGNMEPAGLVNLITKSPLNLAQTTLEARLSSFAYGGNSWGDELGLLVTADTTGPLSDRASYRFVAQYEQRDSFRTGVDADNVAFFPTVRFELSEESSLLIGAEWVKERRAADDGLVAPFNDIALVAPIETRYQEPGDFDHDEGLGLKLQLDHRFSNDWRMALKWRSVFHEDERRLFENNRVNDTNQNNQPLPSDRITLRRFDRHQLNQDDYHYLDANVRGAVSTGVFRHELLLGITAGYQEQDYSFIRYRPANISVYDPQSGAVRTNNISTASHRLNDLRFYGLYAQDRLKISEGLTLLGALRYDRQDFRFAFANTTGSNRQETDAWVPTAGLVYQVTPQTSFYASYGESFLAPEVERRPGDSFDNETGAQFEVGAKSIVVENKLIATVAWFDIAKRNVLEPVGNRQFEQLGDVGSRGVEAELIYQPSVAWQLKAGYAYVDTEVTASADPRALAQPLPIAPMHDFYLRVKSTLHRFSNGNTIGASAGVVYESERFTDAASNQRVRLPGYSRIDLGFSYSFASSRVALKIENALDRTYYQGGRRDFRIMPGVPRRLTLSLRHSF